MSTGCWATSARRPPRLSRSPKPRLPPCPRKWRLHENAVAGNRARPRAAAPRGSPGGGATAEGVRRRGELLQPVRRDQRGEPGPAVPQEGQHLDERPDRLSGRSAGRRADPRAVRRERSPEEHRRGAQLLAPARVCRRGGAPASARHGCRGARVRPSDPLRGRVRVRGHAAGRERPRDPSGAVAVLSRWTLGRKIALPAAVAAVALGLVLIATVVLGRLQSNALARIEGNEYPALQTQQQIVALVGAWQRQLQDAAAAADRDGLLRADSLARVIRTAIASNDARDLEAAFARYETTARPTTESLIDGRSADLEAMRSGYASFRALLDAETARRAGAVAREFAAARRLRARAELATLVITVTALVLGAGLATAIVRGITRALRGCVAVAERLADGDTAAAPAADTQDEIGQLL